MGVLVCVFGMIVSAQEVDSNDRICTNGVLIVVAGIVPLVLAAISHMITDAIPRPDR